MDNDKVLERILNRIDIFDEKLEKKTDELYDEVKECNNKVNDCTLKIQGVKKDLTNHLKNEKKESDILKRNVYYIATCFGIFLGIYTTFTELF